MAFTWVLPTTGAENDALTAANTGSGPSGPVATAGSGIVTLLESNPVATRAWKCTATSASGAQYFQKTSLGGATNVAWALLVKRKVAASANVPFFYMGTTSRLVSMEFDASGHLVVKNQPFAAVFTSTQVFALETWYWVRVYLVQSGTVGVIKVDIAAATAPGTSLDSTNLTAQNTGSAAYTDSRMGSKTSTGTQTQTIVIGAWGYDLAATDLGPVYDYTASPSDSAGITDSVSAVMTMVREIADSAGITDTPGPQVMAIEIAQDDTAGATDAVDVVASAARTIADQAGVSDSVSAVLTALASVADQASITDSATAAATVVRILGDPAAITDTAAAIVSAVRQVDDAAGATDAASVVVSAARTIADVAGITDSVTATIYLGATVDDTTGATDAVEVTIAAYRSPAEAVAASDAVATILSAQRQTDDQAGITDAATAALAAVRQIDDNAWITDDASVLMVSVRTISDGASVTDTVIAVLGSDIPAEGGDVWAPRPPIRLVAPGAPIRTYAPRRRA